LNALPFIIKYVKNLWMLDFTAVTGQVMSTASLPVNILKY